MKYLYLVALFAAGTMSCAETKIIYTPEELMALRTTPKQDEQQSPKAVAIGKAFSAKFNKDRYLKPKRHRKNRYPSQNPNI